MKSLLRIIASAALFASLASTHAARRDYTGIEDTTMSSQQSHNVTVVQPRSVPDGGTTMLLLGGAVAALALGRRLARTP